MGILRVYLALCVVAAHSTTILPWGMHSGPEAVQIFYMISGFYMAMVLSTRYQNSQDFYFSRFLRVFPPYYAVLIITLVLSVAAGLISKNWLALKPFLNDPTQHNGFIGLIIASCLNLTLVGQDWIMFLSHPAGEE